MQLLITTEKTEHEQVFHMFNQGWSDDVLFNTLLLIVSEHVLFSDIVSIQPTYFYHHGETHSLTIHVTYLK